MNPVIRNVALFYNLIAPWASGDWTPEVLASEEFAKSMGEPSNIVFEIPNRALPGWFEALLLGKQRTADLMAVISWVTRVNTAIARYNLTFENAQERVLTAKTAHGAVAKFKDVLNAAKAAL